MIRLCATELIVAAYIGSARNVQSLKQGAEPGAGIGTDNTWTPNIEGAAGEMAVAKSLGVYWLPRIGDRHSGDVARYEVRTNTSRRYDDTILRPKDEPGRVYIGVLSFMPDFEIMGWIWGTDAKRADWLRDGSLGRPACFFVPRPALRPMDELPGIEGLR